MLLVMMALMFAASTAFAINLTSRSEEMVAQSSCDQAGSITLSFTHDDWNIIDGYLTSGSGSHPYVKIRVTLTGTDIDPNATPPTLCEAISGTADVSGKGLPTISTSGDGYVAINEVPAEVSDLYSPGGADVTAYVYGAKGSRFFDIYITAMQEPPADDSTPPYIKVGLHDELNLPTEESTAICAQVSAFTGLSKLTCSYNFTPTSLTITGSDNEIGHFLESTVTMRNCDPKKDNLCINTETKEIQLCTNDTPDQSCSNYYKCAVIEGDFPSSGDAYLTVRTNGATDGAATQKGVYLTNYVILTNGSGYTFVNGRSGPTGNYTNYEADGKTTVSSSDFQTCAKYKCQNEKILVDLSNVSTHGNKIQLCIDYTVDPAVATLGSTVQFWIDMETVPCGNITSGYVTGAKLVECGVETTCMYFPYVLQASAPWATGIAVSNLTMDDSTPVAVADMEVVFTLIDSTGAVFTGTKNDFTTAVYATTVDNLVTAFGWTPAAGPCILKLQCNFASDGYSFVTDGNFGGSTLPRLQSSCSSVLSLR
jgi:hypothetical protein